MLEPVTLDSRAYRRGLDVFDEDVPKSFNLDLSDLSRDVVVAAAAAGRLRRRSQDAALRRSDLRAIERRGRRRDAVPARAQAQHRGLRVGAEAAEPRPLLQRRRQRRLRRARLRHRRVVLSRARVDGGPHADEAPRQVACARRADAALRRQPQRLVGHERRIRPPAVPARAQPEQRARQPAVAGGARFPDDADGRPTRAVSTRQSIQDDRSPWRVARADSAAVSPTTCRSCRRSPSGCSAIATTGIRRTRSPTTPRRAFGSPCRWNTASSARALPETGSPAAAPAAPIEGSTRTDSAHRRTRSSRRSRCAISAS